MKPIVMNPNKSNDNTDALLQALLTTNNSKVLEARKTYPLNINLPLSSPQKVELSFKLTHSVTPQLTYRIFNGGKLLSRIFKLERQRLLSNTEDLPFSLNIDPKALDKTSKAFLTLILEKEPKLIKIEAQQDYPLDLVTDTLPPQNFQLILRFTSPMLIRPRQSKDSQTRIEIQGKCIGKGSFGKVALSLGVLEVENDLHFKIKPAGKQRVIKEIPLDKASKKQIEKEARNTQEGSDYLHCKSALFSNEFGYLVMKKAPGEELFDLINKLRGRKLIFTVTDYMQLSLALMKAVDALHDKNLVHRDLKPENLFIKLPNMQVTIIDHAFSKKIIDSKKSKCCKGTLIFLAPEVLRSAIYSKASDNFALGYILAVLWGDETIYELGDNQQVVYDWSQKPNRFINLFQEMDLSENLKTELRGIFDNLAHPDSNKRNLKECIKRCESLYDELKNDPQNKLQ